MLLNSIPETKVKQEIALHTAPLRSVYYHLYPPEQTSTSGPTTSQSEESSHRVTDRAIDGVSREHIQKSQSITRRQRPLLWHRTIDLVLTLGDPRDPTGECESGSKPTFDSCCSDFHGLEKHSEQL